MLHWCKEGDVFIDRDDNHWEVIDFITLSARGDDILVKLKLIKKASNLSINNILLIDKEDLKYYDKKI